MNQDILESTLSFMNKTYGSGEAVGIDHVASFLPTLKQFSFADIIEYELKNFSHRPVLDFILSAPALWQELDSSVWITILTRPGIRKDASKIPEQVAYFADIEFLNRYVGVDALSFVMSSPIISTEEKNHVFSYFAKFSFALPSDRLDVEDLDGVYFVKQQVLKDLRTMLIRDQGFSTFDVKEGNINDYIENLRKRRL